MRHLCLIHQELKMSDHEAADLHHEDYVDVEELLRGSDEEDDVSPPVDDLLSVEELLADREDLRPQLQEWEEFRRRSEAFWRQINEEERRRDEAQEEADRREEEELEERARLNSIIRYLDTISDQSIEE